jgi:hypothetical protein
MVDLPLTCLATTKNWPPGHIICTRKGGKQSCLLYIESDTGLQSWVPDWTLQREAPGPITENKAAMETMPLKITRVHLNRTTQHTSGCP